MTISDEENASDVNEYLSSISCLQHTPDILPEFLPNTDAFFNDVIISEDDVKDYIMILQLHRASKHLNLRCSLSLTFS